MKTWRSISGILLALILSVGVFVAGPVFAQEVDLAAFGEAAGFTTNATITVIIARLIRTAITFVGVIAVVFLVYGGFVWMTAGGNDERVKTAKKIITNAIIGLLLVFASFAIVSFVLGALVGATGSDISSSSSNSSSYGDGVGSSVFYLSSVNTECAESLQNLQLQFVFSKSVDSDTVEEGIVIADSEGTPVDGTFSTAGRTVTFTPSAACDTPYEDEFCFDASSDYTIEVDSSVIDSSAGSSLTCTATYPCDFGFTTGTEVDIEDPTVVMDTPDNGESLYAGSIELIQALTTDDSGVSTVDFYLIDDDEAIYSSGVDYSSMEAVTGANVENAFFTDTAQEWDTEGYTTNEEYNIWAKGYDCAGNTDTASRVTVVLRAANCNNEVRDEDLGETEVDCGGDSSSAFYCGSCDGDECTEDSECASGQCVEGQCVTTPKIEGVSPGDGASGNLITISGEGFGDDEGVITFLGTESGDEVELSAYECNASTQWSDSEIIVQVPSAAVDGPVSITTSSNQVERTDDDYGPSINPFDVNAIERPGVCLLDPDEDDYGSSIDVYGNSFGDDQGSSTFYFTNYEASSYVSWEDEQLEVVVPNVNSGNYRGQVFTGDFVCVKPSGEPTFTACALDEDCDTDAGESCATRWCSETLEYCGDDDDCGDEGGDCDSIRVGSNKVSFTVADTSSSSSPIISSIDSGWKACSDDSVHCGDDDDCGSEATCEDALNWGPAGQYITVYGTGFGTSTGSIFFENESLGYTALGDTDFPDACGDDFWHDTYITVKVPGVYQTQSEDAIATITHALTVERADGQESDPTDFVVLDDTPGPAICDIDPSTSPTGEEVTVYGENFGTADGTVTFYSLQDAGYTLWENDEISSVVIPDEAVTGSVFVTEAENSYTSNSITFTVGDCREDASLCAEGESCCSNGACSTSCEDVTEVEAHYAFMITTGITPNTPRVLVACSASGVSPSPWEGWSEPEDVCVNAAVEAEFNMAMAATTINASTVVVRKCTTFFTVEEEEDEDAACSFSGIACDEDADCTLNDERCVLASEGECKTWTPVEPLNTLQPVVDATGFSWSPKTGLFDTLTLYRVSLQGVDQMASAAGGYMEEDYEWEFTTSALGAPCQVGDVNVRPVEYTQTQQADVAYSAQLTAANDRCVALSCVGYTVGWESDFDGAVIDVAEPGVGICANVVDAQDETLANDPALITAEVTNAANTPSDRGELTINFVDPEIDDYFPQCSTACINALPWGEFNTVMDASTIGASSVTLYECLNSLCETSGLVAVDVVDSISYSPITQRFFVDFETGQTMDPNTWYRVVVDGSTVLSFTGVALSESGSNYGSDENRYFEDDFSWTFKTKDDAVSCAIDSVTLDPEVATMSYVGQRAEFDATAQGEPDDCSASGQTLQSGSYAWETWSATDSPNNVGATSGSATSQNEITAYMILNGAIKLTTEIPSYCTAACLNAGASVTTADGVCGNGAVEASEECDDGGVDNGDGCSSSCLNEGNDQCPLTCEESGVACVNDASCAETCVGSVCGAAADVNEVCTLDSTCDSGSCSEAGKCEEYEDAGASCTSITQCDSLSCVGECSISGEACAGQSSDCTFATGDTCEISGTGCCGDGVRQWTIFGGGEECDDGNLETGDGCSAVCRNEGSRFVDAVCGDGVRDWVVSVGGEDCDDGNTIAGDGCSRNCLLEGSASEEDVYAICGNGVVEAGEDCDPGNYAAVNDGCSTSCLKEGTPSCPTITSLNCCGNNFLDVGEECDNTEGCTNRCLRAGSSFNYSISSFCGDGNAAGIGEECDADPNASRAIGDYGVAQVAQGAPIEVNVTTGYAVSTVLATGGGETGDATLQLQCACTTDLSCSANALGCGDSNCCFARPTLGVVSPPDNVVYFEAGEDEGYCRNTAVWVEFSELMDETTFDATQDTDGDGVIDQNEFDANLSLDLVSVANAAGDQVDVTTIGACPTGYQGAAVASDLSSASRIWNWLKQFVLGIFGREAAASATFACHVPVSYQIAANTNGSSRVYLRYSQLLEENAVYRLVVVGDENRADASHEGVLSNNGVSLCLGANCTAVPFVRAFAVGEEICDLDRVLLEDTGDVDAFFSATGENHAFVATPQTYRSGFGYEEISPLPGVYDWAWSWASSIAETSATNVVAAVAETPQDTTRNFTASGNNGREITIATSTITADILFDPTTDAIADNPTTLANEAVAARTVSGTLEVQALLCENPWPSLSSSLGFPYLEDDLPSNFSFYYCRDQGADGTQDDLSALEDPIDVASLSSSGILQELIFKVEDSSDAIGIRVLPNETYLTPSAWVEEQDFTGTFTETELDGYPAVFAGNTLYAAAANVSGSTIYPNIYIVSYNENASDDAQAIFDQLLENWRFNGNTDEVTDINLCQDETTLSYELYYEDEDDTSGEYVTCEWDGDCYEAFEDETIVCDAQKGKLTRDMTRLLDVVDMATTIDEYGESNGHCAVTKGQSCENDDQCPGTEECLAGFPEVQSGTFVPALSNSIWSSWSAALGNDLGTALPTDPINKFFNCSAEGYDAASCWNGEAGSFICPDNSHLYAYQSVGGEAYLLYAQLELDGDYIWQGDIDASSTDEATVVVEYPVGNAPATGMPLGDGFASVPVFCDGGTWGASTLCGDGTQGLGEVCEIGDTQTGIACSVCVNPDDDEIDGLACTAESDCGTDGDCVDGTTLYACAIDSSNQCFWNTAASAACIPYACGNGILDPGEACDDGSLNGTYGHCSDSCTFVDALYCGDGYLAASEQCDCGTTTNWPLPASSWAVLNSCAVSNGQYIQNPVRGCAYNCTVPGPSCGDGRVNGSEQCDGGYEETIGKLCSDNFTECSTDADCPGAYTCSVAAAGIGSICLGGDNAGSFCDDNGDCGVGACSTNTYDLYRYRACTSSCAWPATWTGPVGGTQICGNGTVEGNEACDDGNSTNNDSCLNTCVENVCGDDYVYVGVESCDDGDSNGTVCEAGYEDTCNYCNTTCQYKTASGGYCGDGEVNGGEVCDGAYSTRFRYFNALTNETLGACSSLGTDTDATPETPATPEDVYTCHWLGVCNGGSENGEYCTLYYPAYVASDTIVDYASAINGDACDGTGECVPPVCADNCGSSCPTSFATTGLLVQSVGSVSPTESVNLYSYDNPDNNSPDSGTLFVPACSVATQLTATIDNQNVVPPDVDIVFVTDLSGSMEYGVSTAEPVDSPERRIDYVVEATQDAIETLFDAYDGSGATMRISLVSFSGEIGGECTSEEDPGSLCFEDSDCNDSEECVFEDGVSDGVSTDIALSGESSESNMLSIMDGYLTSIGGGTTTYNGIEEAVGILEDSDAEVKIVILLSDGEPAQNSVFSTNGDWDQCDVANHQTTVADYPIDQDWVGVPACVVEIAEMLIDPAEPSDEPSDDDFDPSDGVPRQDIIFYSAAVTTDPVLEGYMAHMSSNVCEWDVNDIGSTSDCTGNYAFAASTSEEIGTMYQAIVDSILGTNVTFTATDSLGVPITTTGQVQSGSNVGLPFPDGFVCQSTQQNVPVRNVFYGTGTMEFSDFTLTYCPYGF